MNRAGWTRVGMWVSCALSAVAGLFGGAILFLAMAGFLGWYAYGMPSE